MKTKLIIRKQNGEKPEKGGKIHTGLDLFALDGTPVYACMDGIIHYNYTDEKKIMVMDIEYFQKLIQKKGQIYIKIG